MPEQYDYAALLRNKCKVCRSTLRSQIDLMLMGKETKGDDEPYTYAEILDWAGARGLTISAASLSRHRNNHLMADVLSSIETQRTVQAIAEATGQELGMETAFLQMLVSKAMNALSNIDALDLSGKGTIGAVIRSIETLLKVKKTEVHLSKEKVKEAGRKLTATGRSAGVSEETLQIILRDVYGLIDEEPPHDPEPAQPTA